MCAQDEFLALLHQLFPANCDENEQHVDAEFKRADRDRSKRLSFDEFKAYYSKLKTLYERLNEEREAAEAAEEAARQAAAAAAASKAAEEAARAAKAVAAAKAKADREAAAEEARKAKEAARAAAEEAAREAMREAAEEAARLEEERRALEASMVACKCGIKFLPHLLPEHQRSCEACKPKKAPAPPSSEPPRESVEFAEGVNGFVPCDWCDHSLDLSLDLSLDHSLDHSPGPYPERCAQPCAKSVPRACAGAGARSCPTVCQCTCACARRRRRPTARPAAASGPRSPHEPRWCTMAGESTTAPSASMAKSRRRCGRWRVSRRRWPLRA